jgi:hypothetical protein
MFVIRILRVLDEPRKMIKVVEYLSKYASEALIADV